MADGFQTALDFATRATFAPVLVECENLDADAIGTASMYSAGRTSSTATTSPLSSIRAVIPYTD